MTLTAHIARILEGWSSAREAVHAGAPVPLRLCSRLLPVSDAGTPPVEDVPDELSELWALSAEVRLFEDIDFGQWGLALLPRAACATATRVLASQRRREHRDGDLVIGRFLGDSDLLLMRTDPRSADWGQVCIALPLDRRDDWYYPKVGLQAFIQLLSDAQGAKFWELASRRPPG